VGVDAEPGRLVTEIIAIGRPRKSGWPVSMHVVTLGDGGLLVHSPLWVGDETFARVASLGTPRILFAPNHYHHLSLGRFRERWPEAALTASARAIPRLLAQGHEGLRPLEDVALPKGLRWLVPEGTKSGEAWVGVDDDGGATWIVCDAFFHATGPLAGLEALALRLLKATPGLSIGRTFTGVCLADKARYRDWVREAIARDRPRRVLFSHGEELRGDDTPARLEGALRERLG
jgi:hypothetical protein